MVYTTTMTKLKETERGMPDKKLRKGSTTNMANDVSQPQLKLLKDEDIYANVVKFEEDESKQRGADKDSVLFVETCEKLKTIFAEIAELKALNTPKAEEEVKEKRIRGTILLAMLKKLNRLDKLRLRAGRDALQKEKFQVEKNKLQLQNLLYEADHLRKEVQHCLQFKSQDEEIDLVPLEEFYREAPETISRREKTETDEHARRLARLEWELQQRKQLSIMCNELQMAKEKVAEEIESKTNRLDSLMPCLDSLLKATRPLQDALEINVEKEWAVQKVASLLPRPLYVVYMNLSAYAEISDRLVTTVINGDEDEAKDLDNSAEKASNAVMPDEPSPDSDIDDNDPENENEHSTKKHHHRRQASVATVEVNVFKPHPLSVTFTIKLSETAATALSVTLYYLPAIRFVTVQTKLIDFVVNGYASRDVLDASNILNCLVSHQCGNDEMLHPKTVYTLKRLSLDRSSFLARLLDLQLGKPYGWAQNLCGLNFIDCSQSIGNNATVDYELTQQTVPNIVKKIRNRLQSRLSLYRQILDLEQKNIDSLLITSGNPMAAVRALCVLVQWTSITWHEYVDRNIVTARFIEGGVVSADNLMYSAIIIRGSAKLECLINISPDFPNSGPLWALCLSWNGNRNAANNADIREMEHWINAVQTTKKNANYILGVQLKRAMTALDIYVETEGLRSSDPPAEFRPERTFLKAFRGRTHARPYKIVQNGGSPIYTQI